MLIFQFLCIPRPLLHLLLSVFIAMAKPASKCRVKLKSKQTSQAPVLLARLRISIHLKLTSCWSVLERNIRCNQSSPPVCLLLSLICNVINGGRHADLPGLVIKDSLHEVRDVEGFIQDQRDFDATAASENDNGCITLTEGPWHKLSLSLKQLLMSSAGSF